MTRFVLFHDEVKGDGTVEHANESAAWECIETKKKN